MTKLNKVDYYISIVTRHESNVRGATFVDGPGGIYSGPRAKCLRRQ